MSHLNVMLIMVKYVKDQFDVQACYSIVFYCTTEIYKVCVLYILHCYEVTWLKLQ